MAKCYDCKTSDAKFSIDRVGMSVALCPYCANKELKKQGREQIK